MNNNIALEVIFLFIVKLHYLFMSFNKTIFPKIETLFGVS